MEIDAYKAALDAAAITEQAATAARIGNMSVGIDIGKRHDWVNAMVIDARTKETKLELLVRFSSSSNAKTIDRWLARGFDNADIHDVIKALHA